MAEAIAIVGLVDACISLTKVIIATGQAAKDGKGVPPKVKDLFENFPVLRSLFEKAKENEARLSNQNRMKAKPVLESCEAALRDWEVLCDKICPEDNESNFKRVWKATKAQFLGRNSDLCTLWEKINGYLETLEQLEIFSIGDSLKDLKMAMHSLEIEDEGSHTHFGSGNLNHNSGSGHQFIQGGGENNQFTQNYVTPQPTPVDRPWLVARSANPQFRGYSDVLSGIEKRVLQDPSRVVFVLAGMGDVGKSEIILQFLQRYESQVRARFGGVFWVDCETETSATHGFNEVAILCGWPKDTHGGCSQGVKARLSSHSKRTLLVLDNCDDKSMHYGRYIPHGTQVSVLMATRLSDSKRHATVDGTKNKDFYSVEGLKEADAVELVFEILGDSNERNGATDTAATQMVAVVDYHPFAIIVANSLVRTGIASLLTYAADYQREMQQRNLLGAEESGARYKRISESFEVSASALQDRALIEISHQDALELLDLLAFLDRTNVPEDLFTRAWESEQTILQDGDNENISWLTSRHIKDSRTFLGDPPRSSNERVLQFQKDDRLNRLRQARALLCQLSLIMLEPRSKAMSLHPLVHSWARYRVPNVQRAWGAAASLLALSAYRVDGSPFSVHLGKHIESIWCYDAGKSTDDACLHRCKLYFILTWQSLGSICLNSHELSSMLLDQTRSLFSKESEQVVATMYLSAICNSRVPGQDLLGNWQEVVQAFNRAYGTASIDSLLPRNELAKAYASAGQSSKAIRLLEDTDQRYSELVKEKHPARRELRLMLADACIQNGQLSRAISLLEDLVAIESTLQDEHRQVFRVIAMKDLVSALIKDGQALRTVEPGRDMVKTAGRNLRDRDPRLLEFQMLLARANLTADQISEAIELLESAVKIGKSSLRENHKSLLGCQTLLARAYLRDSRASAAIPLLEHVAKCYEISRPEHDRVRLSSQRDLGLAYQQNGSFEKAIHLVEAVVSTQKRFLPQEHRKRLESELHLGMTYLQSGRFEDAVALLEHVVAVQGMTRGEEDSFRLFSQHCLGEAYGRSGRFDDAIRLMEHVVEVEGTTLVEENSTRLCSQHDLATAYLDGGRYEEGIRLLEHVVKIKEAVLPQEDHDRLVTEFTLGLAYLQTERVKDSIRLLGHVVKICSKICETNSQTLGVAKQVLLQAFRTD